MSDYLMHPLQVRLKRLRGLVTVNKNYECWWIKDDIYCEYSTKVDVADSDKGVLETALLG